MLKVAIVDDDINHLEVLKSHIVRYQEENNLEIEITTFSSGLHLIVDYEPIYNIIFLDIGLPHMNGIEVAKSVRTIDPYSIIIFITNMEQYAIKGYEVNAYDYMIKPIDYFLFSIRLRDVIRKIANIESRYITITTKDESRNIKANEILYFDVSDHLITVHTNKNEYQMLGSLKEMEEELKDCYFIRCNKSFLINLQYVKRVKADRLILQGDRIVKISRNKHKEVRAAFIEYYSNEI